MDEALSSSYPMTEMSPGVDTGVAFEKDEQGCYQAKDFTGTGFVPGYDFIHKLSLALSLGSAELTAHAIFILALSRDAVSFRHLLGCCPVGELANLATAALLSLQRRRGAAATAAEPGCYGVGF